MKDTKVLLFATKSNKSYYLACLMSSPDPCHMGKSFIVFDVGILVLTVEGKLNVKSENQIDALFCPDFRLV